MKVNYSLNSLEPTLYSNITKSFEQIAECPICKKSISPIHLNSVYFKDNIKADIEVHLFCNGCKHSFIAQYTAPNHGTTLGETTLVSVLPNKFIKKIFEKDVENLSPQFVKIYNQSMAAEVSELDEIAGLGYRKSLEFLIKDFAISKYPEDKEKIEKLMLSPCIKEYIDDRRIQMLATKSAWIGNDEAHYVRKQENRDITDMKKFIKAIVYYISVVLITNDADTISSK